MSRNWDYACVMNTCIYENRSFVYISHTKIIIKKKKGLHSFFKLQIVVLPPNLV